MTNYDPHDTRWMEGAYAYDYGDDIHDNPYPAYSAYYYSWRDGWFYARDNYYHFMMD